MLIGVIAFGLMDVSIKVLVDHHYATFQVLAIRGWIMSLLFLISILYHRQLSILYMKKPLHHFLRAAIGMGSSFGLFAALKWLPVATVAVIGFGSPFVMTTISIFLFKDSADWHRWVGIFGGFAGIALASLNSMHHGNKNVILGVLLAFFGMFCYASWNLATRWLSKRETSESLIFSYMWMVALISTLTLPYTWHDITWPMLFMMLAVSIFGFCGQLFVTKAYFHAEVGMVAPLEYLLFLVAAGGDFFIWNRAPDKMTWIGCGIVIISGLIMMSVERHRFKQESSVSQAEQSEKH